MVEGTLQVIGIVLLLLFCLAALVSLVFGLPGTFLIVLAALVYGWASGFAAVGWSTVGWLLAMAVTAEAIEFAASASGMGGRRPSRRVAAAAIVGALAGGIAGAPLLFGLGALLGALAGAFVGASIAAGSEGQSAVEAFRAGLAAMCGRFLGFVVKVSIAAVMLVVLAFAIA